LRARRAEALRWLLQAENDLGFARAGVREGYYAQACFVCQQVCEKALKSIHYGALGRRFVHGHSLLELASALEMPAELREAMGVLDQYYIPTRYPNGLPGALPYEVYTQAQAGAAVEVCGRVIAMARSALPVEDQEK